MPWSPGGYPDPPGRVLQADGTPAGQWAATPAVIANGTSLAPAVDLGTGRIAAIQTPSAWTAAAITFQGSNDNVNFGDIWDAIAGTELTIASAAIATAAMRYLILDFAKFAGVRYVKVRSGTGTTPVNQGAQRTLQLITVGR